MRFFIDPILVGASLPELLGEIEPEIERLKFVDSPFNSGRETGNPGYRTYEQRKPVRDFQCLTAKRARLPASTTGHKGKSLFARLPEIWRAIRLCDSHSAELDGLRIAQWHRDRRAVGDGGSHESCWSDSRRRVGCMSGCLHCGMGFGGLLRHQRASGSAA